MPEHSFPLIGGGVVILTVFVDRKNEACRMEKKIRTGTLRAAARQKVRPSSFVRCELFLRDIRDVEILASFRERGPGITHSDVVFACFWIMFCFLCERCASGSCFPCGLAFGSHLMFPSHPSSSRRNCRKTRSMQFHRALFPYYCGCSYALGRAELANAHAAKKELFGGIDARRPAHTSL